jgi:hypothetical protein
MNLASLSIGKKVELLMAVVNSDDGGSHTEAYGTVGGVFVTSLWLI